MATNITPGFGPNGDIFLKIFAIGERDWGSENNNNLFKIAAELVKLYNIKMEQLDPDTISSLQTGIQGSVLNYSALSSLTDVQDKDIYITQDNETVGGVLKIAGAYQYIGGSWNFLFAINPNNITFLQLGDTPSSYSGKDGMGLVVDETNQKIGFIKFALDSDLLAEITARENGDNALQSQITSNVNEIGNNSSNITNNTNAINTERQERIDADTNLSNRITTNTDELIDHENRIQSLEDDVDVEIEGRLPLRYVVDKFVTTNDILNQSPASIGISSGTRVAVSESAGGVLNGNIYHALPDDTWELLTERFQGLSVILNDDNMIYTYSTDDQSGEYVLQSSLAVSSLYSDGNRPVRRVIKEIVTDQNIVSNAPSVNSYVAGDRVALFDTSDPRNGNIYEAQSDNTWLLIETAFNGLSVINLSDNSLGIFTGSTWESVGELPQGLTELLDAKNRPVRRVIKEIITDHTIIDNPPNSNSYVTGDRVALFDTSDLRNGNIYEAQSDNTWLLIETAFNGLSVINLSDNSLGIFTGSTWESVGELPQDLINFANKWNVDSYWGSITSDSGAAGKLILDTHFISIKLGELNNGIGENSLYIGNYLNGVNQCGIIAGSDIDIGSSSYVGSAPPSFVFGDVIRKQNISDDTNFAHSFVFAENLYVPAGHYNNKFLVWNKNIGFQVLQPTERVEIGGGVKVGEALDTKDGTIQFKDNKLQGRQNGAWKDLISDYLNDEALYLQPFNVISNGDMEIGDVNLHPASWVIEGGSNNIARNHTVRYTGNFSTKFTKPVSDVAKMYQKVFLPIGDYIIKFFAQGVGSSSVIKLSVIDNNGNTIASINPSLTNSWAEYNLAFSILDEEQPIKIIFENIVDDTSLYLDYVRLMVDEGISRAITSSTKNIENKIEHSYTKIINGETDHFISDGLDWIEFSTWADSGIDIGLASGFVSLYSNSGTGDCSVTTDYKRLKNYLLSTMFNYDRGSQTGENATFNIFFNRNLSGQFYSLGFKFDDGVCNSLILTKDGDPTVLKTISLKNADGNSISLGVGMDYKIDVISNSNGTIDLYLDGVLQRSNTHYKHTVDSLDYTWGTSGLGANFQQTGLKFNVKYFNLYQKNEVIEL